MPLPLLVQPKPGRETKEIWCSNCSAKNNDTLEKVLHEKMGPPNPEMDGIPLNWRCCGCGKFTSPEYLQAHYSKLVW